MRNNCGLICRIEKTENLYEIARRYHVGISELICSNPYVNVYHLQPGDEIYIPVCIKERMNNCEETVKDAGVR